MPKGRPEFCRNIKFRFLGKGRIVRICIGVNKMDCDTAGYKQARYDEIANEMKSMLVKAGRPSTLPASKANPSTPRTFGLPVALFGSCPLILGQTW